MSDLMFNEVPVTGMKYNFGDWKLYAAHDDAQIRGFFGEYRWLSNFPNYPIFFEGIEYSSPECAYQAQKVIKQDREKFKYITSSESKKLWKSDKITRLYESEHWDKIKLEIMKGIIFDKFYRTYNIRNLLLETKDKYLEETNHWHDNFYGVCICQRCGGVGQNNLGKILMKVREFWK